MSFKPANLAPFIPGNPAIALLIFPAALLPMPVPTCLRLLKLVCVVPRVPPMPIPPSREDVGSLLHTPVILHMYFILFINWEDIVAIPPVKLPVDEELPPTLPAPNPVRLESCGGRFLDILPKAPPSEFMRDGKSERAVFIRCACNCFCICINGVSLEVGPTPCGFV